MSIEKMKLKVALFLIAFTGYAEPPVGGPPPSVLVKELETSFLDRCVRIVGALKQATGLTTQAQENVKAAEEIVESIRKTSIPEINRVIKSEVAVAVASESYLALARKVSTLRRCIDELAVESMAGGQLLAVQKVLPELRILWDAERFLTLRLEGESVRLTREMGKTSETKRR